MVFDVAATAVGDTGGTSILGVTPVGAVGRCCESCWRGCWVYDGDDV